LNESDTPPPTATHPRPRPWLSLSTRTTGSGVVIVTHAIDSGSSRELGGTPAECPSPSLPWAHVGVSRLVALDVLEHVIDEASWLRAMVNAIAPGGELIVRVPVEGPVAWLDALNLARYMQEITGWGKQPQEARMKGWHRHYRPHDVERLLTDAGLTVTHIARSGSPHLELAQLGALVSGIVTGGAGDAGDQAKRTGKPAEAETDLPRLGLLSTKLTVRAVKTT